MSWPSNYRIEHCTGQGTGHDHDQGDSAGPLLLLELLELVELVSWPSGYRIEHGTGQDTGHDHDQDSSAGPASLVELPATITRRTDQEPPHQARQRPQPRSGRQHRPALAGGAGGAGQRIKHGSGRNHDQGDNTGPPSLLDLVELATGSNTPPAKTPATITTKATASARPCWWSWPPD